MEALEVELGRTVARVLVETAGMRRRQIGRELRRLFGGRCAAGPFRGMLLPEAASWGDGDLAPKLLGAYESELHPALERVFARAPDLVVDVGCAEGWYAVGAALRLPGRIVHAFDLDEKALAICGEAARLNGVAERVRLERRCDADRLVALVTGAERPLVILDCEGFERELVTPSTVPALARADLIVECHDFLEPGLCERLAALLRPTHEIEILREGARDPGAWPVLEKLGSLDRWLAVCEFRPNLMRWIVARPRAS
ncbi:MAG: hypothetical protein KatS3mg117_2147 [Geminicoccaceae bacterium]|jgi:hypothetical protein|nr:MAG: hypothetical protein KatS3mg117_2147 [Geminicoccaceae bacterium]